ncbi:MAG: HlyD family type I secretion periplasmic adaptor subunit [Pseudomonadota bacterium]
MTTSNHNQPLGSDNDPVEVSRDMYDFVPGVLEVQDKPPSPVGRVLAWTLLLLFVGAIGWAFWGKIDIVAVAEGKIIPTSKVKKIQPFIQGMVKTIWVTEGQFVEKGEKLVSFDNTIIQTDFARLSEELGSVENAWLRETFFLKLQKRINTNSDHFHHDFLLNDNSLKNDFIKNLSSINTEQKNFQWLILSERWQEYQNKIRVLFSQINEQRSAIVTNHESIKSLSQTLPLIAQQRDAYRKLAQQQITSHIQLLDAEKAYLDAKQNLTLAMARQNELEANLNKSKHQLYANLSEYRSNSIQLIEELRVKKNTLTKERSKLKEQNDFYELRAPVSGYVKQLSLTSINEVVTPAQELMHIVPKNDILIVEALLPNKDIGYIKLKDFAAIKVHTFPFTKYGTVDSELIIISQDAVEHEQFGLVYPLRFKLKKNHIRVNNKTVELLPGMSVSAEIKTGQRRVIEYFLAPLLKYQQESIKER